MIKMNMRNQKRRDVVEAIVNRQEPIYEAAHILNVPQRTIFHWLAWFRAEGLDRLTEKKRSGRPRKLTGAQIQWVYDCITLGNSQQFQFAHLPGDLENPARPDRQPVEGPAEHEFAEPAAAQAGAEPPSVRPLYQAYRKDPERVNAYLTATFPEAVAKAKQLNAQMFFVDEWAVGSDAQRGTTWGPVGVTPVVKDSGGRFGMTLISAVSPRGNLRFSVIGETMDSSRFFAFLKQMYRDAEGPILGVHDNAKYHHSNQTRRFIEKQNGQTQLVYLPPYSPELNPDEKVWNHAKRELGNRTILSRPALEQAVLSILSSLQKRKDRMRSFF